MRPAAAAALVATLAAAVLAHGADAPGCATVRMSSPGWSDLEATNQLTGVLLKALGYRQHIDTLSVAITYQALRNGQLDVFLGDWTPAHDHFTEPLLAAHRLERLHRNLSGARYTLVVPDYVAAAGVHTFADLAAHGAEFRYQIYGIDAGSPGNEMIEKAIAGASLDGWSVVASSEQGMLSQVARDWSHHRWIVFLGWEPHPMNTRFNLVYLSGGDAFFGPSYGSTSVYTVARPGFSAECPNLARLFGQLSFSVQAENRMMSALAQDPQAGGAIARAYLQANPALLSGWLAGMTTLSGEPGLPAVRAALGL